MDLWQNMARDGAGRGVAHHCARSIRASRRTLGEIAEGVQFDVGLEETKSVRIGGGSIVFQGPSLGGAVDLS